MFKFLGGIGIGFILGIAATVAFIYLGGGGWLQYVGQEAIKTGTKWEAEMNPGAGSSKPAPNGEEKASGKKR
ncbi:MAG: hypothetical protein D6812_03570 [Deltaproteobacteria bacterium]|nr:MAG: hypothetical protein D6812_03570 [Deltaproteobacteria bacterium]